MIAGPRGIFITATDTGVGKTLVTSALVVRLTQWGIDVGVMKPIETGVSRSTKAQSDGARLRRAAGSHDPIAEVCPYVFRRPVAPLSAARIEGVTVKWRAFCVPSVPCKRSMRVWWWKASAVCMSRSRERPMCWTLCSACDCPAIVVGQSGLGGINHALLTLHALRQRTHPDHGVGLKSTSTSAVRRSLAAQEQSTVTLFDGSRRFPW